MRNETPKILALRSADTAGREALRQDASAAPQRDSFVAETAVKIDQLEAGSRTLARTVAEIASKVDAMQEIAGHDHRLHAFDQQERRTREGKLEELMRSFRDLKARLDRIERALGWRLPHLQQLRGGQPQTGRARIAKEGRPSTSRVALWLVVGHRCRYRTRHSVGGRTVVIFWLGANGYPRN